jgi:GDP-L-fucose synthase
MKKVLITGSSGFLGKKLVETLLAKGIEVVCVNSKNADLTLGASLQNAVQNPERFDHIFHLAAWTQAGTFCDTHRGIQWIVNQQINTNVLAWWQQYAPQAKMVTFGTSASYALENELIETKYMDGQPYDKFMAYAMCKRMLLTGVECLHKQYGLQYLYLIPSTIYGANYHTDGRQMHFIYDLVRKIMRGKLYNEPVVLWGDGEQRRELIDIDNFIEIMLALNNKAANDIYNLGGGIDYSIKDFAKIICDKVGYDFNNIQYDTAQYVGAKSKILNVEKYRSIVPTTEVAILDLETGIQKVIEWFNTEKENFLS